MNEVARKIYHKLHKWTLPEDIEQAVRDGMIAKNNLVVGKEYEGYCRNSEVARWTGTGFSYMRYKFGGLFPEEQPHPEDDQGFDIFVPVKEVD